MRISDWSSDVCSSDLVLQAGHEAGLVAALQEGTVHLVRVAEAGHLAELLGLARRQGSRLADHPALVVAVLRLARPPGEHAGRSEEDTSELQSLMRIPYAVFCLKKKKK